MGEGAGPWALPFPGRDGGGTAAVTKPWVPEPAARPWRAWFCEVLGSGTVRLHAWGPPKWLSPPCGSHRGRRDPHHSAGCPEGLVNSSCPGLNPQASPWLSCYSPALGRLRFTLVLPSLLPQAARGSLPGPCCLPFWTSSSSPMGVVSGGQARALRSSTRRGLSAGAAAAAAAALPRASSPATVSCLGWSPAVTLR